MVGFAGGRATGALCNNRALDFDSGFDVRITTLALSLLALTATTAFSQPARVATGYSASVVSSDPKELAAACKAGVDEARASIAALKALPAAQAQQALAVYDALQKSLGDAGARGALAREAHPDAAMRDAGQVCIRDTSALSTQISLDPAIYQALARMDATALDPASRYFLQRTLQRFRLAGVDRDEETRKKVQALNDELTQLSQAFGKHIREGVRDFEADPAELKGVPADFLKAHPPGANGKVVLKTDGPDYNPVLSYAVDPGVRERFWKVYRTRAWPENIATLDRMLARRHELARLLGHANWADYVTADKMIGNGRAAGEFIERIATASAQRAQREYAELLARKRKDDPAATAVNPWDTSYLNDRIRAEQYGVDAQLVRPYFQYDQVKKGVLDITSRLFGIRYEPVRDQKVWHKDVEVYDVFDGAKRMGRIYLDMHPRDNKYKHQAHFRLVYGKDGVALPEGVLLCNFRQPTANDPGLLEYNDVKTYFHEFGHLLHNVLGGHTQWAGIAGVANERDFVEAPSQFLEEWMRDPKTLQTFAIHHQTKQPIPTELVEKLRRADDFGRGMFVRGQMSLAAISLNLHNRDPQGLDTTKLVAEMGEKYTPFKYVPGTYFHTAFGHLDGYSAIYYTYMWSLVIAKDMFAAFTAQGDIMSPATASKYRAAVLAPGGSKPAAELVQDFIGRPYGFGSYEAWLNAQ